MGATKDLYRRAAAVAPELGLIELVVEDYRRSALIRQARAVIEIRRIFRPSNEVNVVTRII